MPDDSDSTPQTSGDVIPSAGPGPLTTAADAPGAAAVAVPLLAGRYELLGEIARGGMGLVLRGCDHALGRDLAVKVLLDTHAGRPEVARRFVDEAQIAGQLQHPGVVPVHELGSLPDGRPFFAMKLVKGRTLAELLRERSAPVADTPGAPADLPRLVQVFEQVCQTVAYAHSKGVIHRDLKPANVMVGAFGEVQVMDWGLAKVLVGPQAGAAGDKVPPQVPASVVETPRSGTEEVTQAGSVLGTYAYMPPEQARGEADRVDRRCDVFGLGAILCEVLTGRPPYTGGSEEVKAQAQLGHLAPAQQRLAACATDADLVALAGACLRPRAEDRPADAAAVAAAVAAYQAGVQSRLRQAETARTVAVVRACEERKRRRLTLALTGLALGLVVLGVAGWLWTEQSRQERREEAARTVERAIIRAEQLSGVARSLSPTDQGRAQEALGVWTQADGAAREAEGIAARGETDASTRRRAADVRARIEAGRKDAAAKYDRFVKGAKLHSDLEAARLRAAQTADGYFDGPAAAEAYARAFRDYGTDVRASVPPEAVALRLQTAPPESSLLVLLALDHWAMVSPNDAARVSQVADRLDRDPWRERLRAAVFRRQPADLKALVARAPTALTPVGVQLLVLVLLEQREDAAAVAVLRRAQHLQPDDFWVNFTLGGCLDRLGPAHQAEAVGYFRAALAARKNSALAHSELGLALWFVGDAEGLERCQRSALALDAKLAVAHHRLGFALLTRGEPDQAVGCFRTAIGHDPNLFRAHLALGQALLKQGQFAEARDATRRAASLVPAAHPLNRGAAVQLSCCERVLGLDERLRAGPLKVGDPSRDADRLALADWCLYKQRYAAAADHFAAVFAASLPGADELGLRYRAAGAAALAADGKGADAAATAAAGRTRLRGLALEWLRADLKYWSDRAARSVQEREPACRMLLNWQQDAELAGVRGRAALDRLPEEERPAWRQLWVDVEAVLARTRAREG